MQLMVLQRESFKQEKREIEKQWQEVLQNNLETETRIRQKETRIDDLLRQLTNQLTQNSQETDPWHGKSPGPEVMQTKTGHPSKQTPTITRMGTPDVDWNDSLQDIIQEWIIILSKINKQIHATHTYIHARMHAYMHICIHTHATRTRTHSLTTWF